MQRNFFVKKVLNILKQTEFFTSLDFIFTPIDFIINLKNELYKYIHRHI